MLYEEQRKLYLFDEYFFRNCSIFTQAQELKIKKQFHDTVKIQYRQYKAYQKQVLQTMPKERHKELIETFKEDRNRKMADLKLQYDQSIYDMLQRQSVSAPSLPLPGLTMLQCTETIRAFVMFLKASVTYVWELLLWEKSGNRGESLLLFYQNKDNVL